MLSWVIIVVMVSFHLIQSRIIKKQINSCNTRAYVTAQVAIFLPFFGQFKMAAKVISTRPFTALQSSRIPFKTIPTLNQFRLNWRDNNATVNKLVSQISHSEGRQTVTRLVDQPMTSRYHFINRALVHSTDQSSFRAVSEQFQSSFRAVSEQFRGSFWELPIWTRYNHLNRLGSVETVQWQMTHCNDGDGYMVLRRKCSDISFAFLRRAYCCGRSVLELIWKRNANYLQRPWWPINYRKWKLELDTSLPYEFGIPDWWSAGDVTDVLRECPLFSPRARVLTTV